MEIRPFRGWRYRQKDISAFVAPPYDVLSADDKRSLLAKSDRNIVAVDLPHVPPKDAGSDEEYAAAAGTLRQWMASGVLARETAPALYAYQQEYAWAGRRFTRRAMIAAVRATPLGQDVIPHEHTFAGPKADRLKLTQHARMQLSPIFGFYADPAGKAAAALWSSADREPDAQGELKGVGEKLWAVSDEAVIRQVSEALREAPVFIADGHHRYTTALNYRDGLGSLHADHPANFVMFVLAERSDPGLVILPTHRTVRGLKEDFSVAKLAESAKAFSWKRVKADALDLSDADAALGPFGPHSMLFMDAAEAWAAQLTDAGAMRTAAPGECDAWRELDVAILHELIIGDALKPWCDGEPTVEYTPDGEAVREACRSGRAQLGFCLQSTPIQAVEAIARAGAAMPHKSTYFYPKLATGMVMMSLE